MEQLETSDNARKAVKKELQEANEKLIKMEEELYAAKNIKGEILDKMKALED